MKEHLVRRNSRLTLRFSQEFSDPHRTMALITHATIIVEAADKSGSLHQGWRHCVWAAALCA
jgi:hypothetical protein